MTRETWATGVSEEEHRAVAAAFDSIMTSAAAPIMLLSWLDEMKSNVEKGADSTITVRELVGLFGYKRRGVWVSKQVRDTLHVRGLETDPDFETTYIDAPVTVRAVHVEPDPAPADGSPDVIAPLINPADSYIVGATVDPTYRISKLEAANLRPLSVKPNESVELAVTLMLARDYSQLPVMTSDFELKGVISWRSIAKRLLLANGGLEVRQMMDEAVEIRSDMSLFEALTPIARHDYVLVRNSANNRINGIITSSDLGQQFRQLAEPFLLIGEIENQIRRLLDGKFSEVELQGCRNPDETGRPISSIADLSFGEYIRVLEEPGRWARIGLKLDRTTLKDILNRVRAIRNDVMHFDPDPLSEDDIRFLRDISTFLRGLSDLGAFGQR